MCGNMMKKYGVEVAPIIEYMMKTRLRWFQYVEI